MEREQIRKEKRTTINNIYERIHKRGVDAKQKIAISTSRKKPRSRRAETHIILTSSPAVIVSLCRALKRVVQPTNQAKTETRCPKQHDRNRKQYDIQAACIHRIGEANAQPTVWVLPCMEVRPVSQHAYMGESDIDNKNHRGLHN